MSRFFFFFFIIFFMCRMSFLRLFDHRTCRHTYSTDKYASNVRTHVISKMFHFGRGQTLTRFFSNELLFFLFNAKKTVHVNEHRRRPNNKWHFVPH